MDIKRSLLYWVRKLHPKQADLSELRGSALAGDDGFGAENSNGYCGTIAIVRQDVFFEIPNAEISLHHSTHHGYSWMLKSIPKPTPEIVPFLVTDNLKVRCIYTGDVNVHPAKEMSDVIFSQESETEFFVGCEEWFGILLAPESGAESNCKLFAFSENPNTKVVGQPLGLLDRVGKFGRVTIADVSKSKQ